MKIKVTGKYLRIIQNMESFYFPEKKKMKFNHFHYNNYPHEYGKSGNPYRYAGASSMTEDSVNVVKLNEYIVY